MNAQEIEFIDRCPAWARKVGVKNLKIWNMIAFLMPFSKPHRFDYLDYINATERITKDEEDLIIRVLTKWDEDLTS